MEQEFEYKNEIVSSRVGCLGGSDANILAQTCALSQVPKSAYKRLAVCKGLIPSEDTFKTAAMVAGDVYENLIFNALRNGNDKWQSNPLLESKKYSMPNCKLICHPDYMYEDEENKTLYIYEVKTTKDNIKETKTKYRNQLWIENQLAKEYVLKNKGQWKVVHNLVVYDTNGLDLENETPILDVNRIHIERVMFKSHVFNIKEAMQIISDFLLVFNEFYNEEINSEYLPEKIKNYFLDIVETEKIIKAKEQEIKDFKAKLCDFFIEKGIKSVKNDNYNITLVESVLTSKFDSAKFKEERPTLYRKYCKLSERKPFVKITPKNK